MGVVERVSTGLLATTIGPAVRQTAGYSRVSADVTAGSLRASRGVRSIRMRQTPEPVVMRMSAGAHEAVASHRKS